MIGQTWTDADMAQLRAEYPACLDMAELASRMGRPVRKLVEKASRLGIKRCPNALAAVRSKANLAVYASGNRKIASQPEPRRSFHSRKVTEWAAVPDLVGVWR